MRRIDDVGVRRLSRLAPSSAVKSSVALTGQKCQRAREAAQIGEEAHIGEEADAVAEAMIGG
jgi:hypothetical protein